MLYPLKWFRNKITKKKKNNIPSFIDDKSFSIIEKSNFEIPIQYVKFFDNNPEIKPEVHYSDIEYKLLQIDVYKLLQKQQNFFNSKVQKQIKNCIDDCDCIAFCIRDMVMNYSVRLFNMNVEHTQNNIQNIFKYVESKEADCNFFI